MDFANNVICTKSASVQSICDPFFDKVGFNFMNYNVLEDNGFAYGLATNGLYCEDFYNTHLTASASLAPEGFSLWQSYQNSNAIQFAQERYDYHYMFTFLKSNAKNKEIFSFAAPKNNRAILQFYQNHPDLLEKFIYYFKDKAQELIQLAQLQKVFFPPRMRGSKKDIEFDITEIDKLISPKKYSITGLKGAVDLSDKEMTCFKLYARGISSKEIAAQLFRSQKTIEFHVSSIKKKLGVSRKKDLINLYQANFYAC